MLLLVSCNKQEYKILNFEIDSDTVIYKSNASINMIFKVDVDEKKFERKVQSEISIAAIDTVTTPKLFHVIFKKVETELRDEKDIIEYTLHPAPIQISVTENKLDSIENWDIDINAILESPDSLLSIIAHKECETLNFKILFNHYTSQSIESKSKWKDSLKFELNGIVHNYELTYRLNNVVENLAYIHVSGNTIDDVFVNEFNKENSKLEGKFEGEIVVDLDTGMLQKGELTSELIITGKRNNQDFSLMLNGIYNLQVETLE